MHHAFIQALRIFLEVINANVLDKRPGIRLGGDQVTKEDVEFIILTAQTKKLSEDSSRASIQDFQHAE